MKIYFSNWFVRYLCRDCDVCGCSVKVVILWKLPRESLKENLSICVCFPCYHPMNQTKPLLLADDKTGLLLLRVNFSPANYVLFTQWYLCNCLEGTFPRSKWWENSNSLGCYPVESVNESLISTFEGLSLGYWQDSQVSSSVIVSWKFNSVCWEDSSFWDNKVAQTQISASSLM